MEKNYEFRQELLQWHRPDLRDPDYVPEPGMVSITEDFCILIPADSGEVLLTAAKDFQDYLYTSMNLSAISSRLREPVGVQLGDRPRLLAQCLGQPPGLLVAHGEAQPGPLDGFPYLEAHLASLRPAYPVLASHLLRLRISIFERVLNGLSVIHMRTCAHFLRKASPSAVMVAYEPDTEHRPESSHLLSAWRSR